MNEDDLISRFEGILPALALVDEYSYTEVVGDESVYELRSPDYVSPHFLKFQIDIKKGTHSEFVFKVASTL